MLELAAKIILISSIVGMGVIVFQKIPVLNKLPLVKIKREEKKIFSFPVFLEEVKSRTKNFYSFLLKRNLPNLKKRYFKKEESKLSADYWEKIKKG
ncbi:MAG: hypothetical protein QMC93_01790 [Patescibacteria group bacterium]|nr:hypothetical protein [Patescibacteria group bacterium]